MKLSLLQRIKPGVVVEILVNFILPWLVYNQSLPRWGEHNALLASALPPVIWSAVGLIRHRRLDAMSALVVAGILLSLGAVMLGGSPSLMLMRESLITGAIGLVFLVSALLRRPLTYYLAQAALAREPGFSKARFEQLFIDANGRVAGWMTLMALVWGGGLLAETVLRLWLVKVIPVAQFLLVAPWISYGIYGALAGWTWWYRGQLRRSGRGVVGQINPAS
ncbi:VC0807 family protein [Silvimonas iriomotensis]|uniref:Intracellular septation protein A n=1 Tax=Silvimonas iriomotensis TaxID=449662 RepID=A0ABQ2PDJ6_9NEIS|nr:VC0807 family protein [Silvimonas iriomotensis]GGP23622.1 hypothetical protein GCM10010970_36220 [Silvimonas iriomotensis]